MILKRLFFALWPDPITRQQCVEIAAGFQHVGKPVAANNLHVTLAFLGQIDAERQIAVTKAADLIQFEPMLLTFDRVDYWKKPGLICLTTAHTDLATHQLAEELNLASRQLGLKMDDRPFRPHVTLLRKARAIAAKSITPIHWQTNSFALLESCSTPTGVEYRMIQLWSLE